MAVGQAVEFSVAPLGASTVPWGESVELNLRLESKATDGQWQSVSEEPVTLRGVNVVTRLDRAQYAYRLSLWPTNTAKDWTVAFPYYLSIPTQAPHNSGPEMCPPNVGTFRIAPSNEQVAANFQESAALVVAESRATQAAAVLGGTLAAAVLLYSLLPYMKVVRRRRPRTRSHPQTTREKESCLNQHGEVYSPKSPIGMGRRFSDQFNNGIEPAGAYRDGIREKRSRAPSDNGSELVLATLPDFNDERGWRDFFDSQIYHSEPEKEQGTRIVAKSSPIIQRRNSLSQEQAKIAKLRHAKSTIEAGEERFQSIKERIDRAAMEAAIDDADNFFEFWQT